MDLSFATAIIATATTYVFAAAMVVVAGYAAVWGIKLVIGVFMGDSPTHDPHAYYAPYSGDSIEYSDFDDLPFDSDFEGLEVDYHDPLVLREYGEDPDADNPFVASELETRTHYF